MCVPEPLGGRGNKQASLSPRRPYQGSLQEEYGSDTLLFLGHQPSVPTAATEPARGLWVQVELGVKGAVLPALLSLAREVLLQGRTQGDAPVPASQVTPACVPARAVVPDVSPSAGRRGSPSPGSAPGPAPWGSGSGRVPSVAGGMNGKSFPPSSRSGAGRRVGFLLHIPSLQGRHHGLWVHVYLQTWGGAWTCLGEGP